MKLIYYTPYKLYSNSDFAAEHPEQYSFSQMFNPSISLIDRTKTINCPPIEIDNRFPFFTNLLTKTETFETLCVERFQQLISMVEEAPENKTIVLFYSGGIDSTLIVTLALKHPMFSNLIANNQIKLVFTEESVKENSEFWYKYIIPNFKNSIHDGSGFYSFVSNTNNICITGELADNLFGSLTLKSYIDLTGDNDAIHKKFSDTGKKWLLSKVVNPRGRNQCSELIDRILTTSPRSLESNHDCFWWLNFILKWQAVEYRLISHAPSSEVVDSMARNIIHFFNTPEFQNWAVMTDELKVDKDWYSYKLPAKKIIYDFNHDDYYFKWKTKYPSIPGLTRYANMFNFVYYDDISDKYIATKDLLNGT